MENSGSANPDLIFSLRRVTERAACAAFNWIGRGDGQDGGRAALDAMRSALADVDIDAIVVIGEAGKGEAPQPTRGERLGRPGAAFKADIAVDPVEGTSYMVRGLTNALAVMAVAPRGAMMNPAPAFYMEKFGTSAPARGKIDPHWPTGKKLETLAAALGKDVSDLTIFVLEKPRHRDLINAILATGARVALYPAGDVAGALMAAIPGSGIDALMGTGGTPEGVMSACAIRAIGGEFLARIDPQLQTEARAVKEAGVDTTKWYGRDEIIASDNVFFCATGITTGLMLEGVDRTKSHYKVQTMMITGATRERQILTSFIPTERLAGVAARDVA
ncbi:MAG: class II fructose-bisphosphatase [Methyloceanibacter sp.]|uniref:class II fructose-bisphosphatase n=1 Tax=Methyloceanibacter sp. TaxID=1965321 RepID=UPI003D9B5702